MHTGGQSALGDFQGELAKVAARGQTTYSKMALQVLGNRKKKEALAAALLNLVCDGLRTHTETAEK